MINPIPKRGNPIGRQWMRKHAAKTNIKMKTQNMKTRKHTVRTHMNFIACQLTVLIAVLGGGWLSAAATLDFNTFAPEESYVVEGVSIVLTQKLGEATVKVGSALQDSSTLTAANGAKFDQVRSLGARSGTYKMESADPLSETASKGAIDSLSQDANIDYAYPVYVNTATGKRHFLNDTLVVRLKEPLGTSMTNVLTPFKMEFIDTLSAGQNCASAVGRDAADRVQHSRSTGDLHGAPAFLRDLFHRTGS